MFRNVSTANQGGAGGFACRRALARFLWCALAASFACAADVPGANDALDRGDFSAAATITRTFLQSHPDSADARVLLARAEIGLNDSGAAMRDLKIALARDANNVEALYYLNKLAAVLSQREFQRLYQIAPDSARVHQLRADGLRLRGDIAAAQREYEAALERNPRSVEILNAVGDMYRHDMHYDQASPWYSRALAVNPRDYDSLYGLGACHLLLREPAEAVPLFRRALAEEPSSLAAEAALGEALLDAGDAKQALPLLDKAVKADPTQRRMYVLLARAYQKLGNKEEADRALRKERELE